MLLLRSVPALLVPALLACAHGRPMAFQPSEVDVSASEARCPYDSDAGTRVTFHFVVLPDGTVDGGTIRHVPSRYDTRNQRIVQQARSVVEACTFEPARKDGRAVAVRITKSFTSDAW